MCKYLPGITRYCPGLLGAWQPFRSTAATGCAPGHARHCSDGRDGAEQPAGQGAPSRSDRAPALPLRAACCHQAFSVQFRARALWLPPSQALPSKSLSAERGCAPVATHVEREHRPAFPATVQAAHQRLASGFALDSVRYGLERPDCALRKGAHSPSNMAASSDVSDQLCELECMWDAVYFQGEEHLLSSPTATQVPSAMLPTATALAGLHPDKHAQPG